MAKEIENDCAKCVNGYFLRSDGWHNLCGAKHCYLCQMQYGGECKDYKEGTPPKGKEPM